MSSLHDRKVQRARRVATWLSHAAFALLASACGRSTEDDELFVEPPADAMPNGRDATPDHGEDGSGSAKDSGSPGQRDSGPDARGDAADAAVTDPNLTPSGYPRCGPLEPDRANDCDGIDKITLLDRSVSGMTDGSIAVGELGPVQVWVRNNDDVLHFDVCVGVRVDTPGILLLTDDGNTNPAFVGQINAGNTPIVTVVDFSVQDVKPGTVTRFTLWPTFRGTNCVGPTASVTALVTSYP